MFSYIPFRQIFLPIFVGIVLSLSFNSQLSAQPARLLKEINFSKPDLLNGETVELNGNIFFAGTDPTHGTELWISKLTTASTKLFFDIVPGLESSFPREFYVVGNTLYFIAFTPATGYELWKTNGTVAGTKIVKDLAPGSEGALFYLIFGRYASYNNTLFFVASTPSTGLELFKTDGTKAGTTIVKDINPGPNDSSPEGLRIINDLISGDPRLIYSADDGVNGEELWRTDPVTLVTSIVTNLDSAATDGVSPGYSYSPSAGKLCLLYGQKQWCDRARAMEI